MSVKELTLYNGKCDLEIKVYSNQFEIQITTLDGLQQMYLDRAQAHLLMLYLQDQLGYVSISKDRLNE